MEKNIYKVLALKYRPKNFSEVIGQEATIQTLMSALDKKQLANAYLFSGLRGSGKTSTARIFAKALQCSKGRVVILVKSVKIVKWQMKIGILI